MLALPIFATIYLTGFAIFVIYMSWVAMLIIDESRLPEILKEVLKVLVIFLAVLYTVEKWLV